MEKLEASSSGRPLLELELGLGIGDPANALKKLTRCTFGGTPEQLSSISLSSKLGTCVRETSRLLPEAAGTGVYFRNVAPSNCFLNSDGEKFSELQDLFNLATVACEVESPVRPCQLVKKRRTPRSFLRIDGPRARFANFNGDCNIELPPEAAAANRQKIGDAEIYSLPWLEKSGRLRRPESSPFKNLTNRKVYNSLNSDMVRERRCTADKMESLPEDTMIKCNRLATGERFVSACSTDLPRPLARRLPGQETRVQGFAKRILQFIGERRTAEKFIRDALGNNPDISKALRLLLRQQKVERLGHGGRGKAFLYVATLAGLRQLEELSHKLTSHEDFMERFRLNLGQDICMNSHSLLKENLFS